MMVQAQFGGKARFASGLFFTRATADERNKIRFYHAMAASAILGLSTYEVMGAGCCDNQSVTVGNKKYLELIEMCKLQTIDDMAIIDARSTIRQVFHLRKSWFSRYNRSADLDNNGIPCSISKDIKGTLIHDLFHFARKKTRLEMKLRETDLIFSAVWSKVIERLLDKPKSTNAEYRLYAEFMRHELKCLNTNHRRLQWLTPTDKLLAPNTKDCTCRPRDDIGVICGPRGNTPNTQVVYIRDKCLVCGEIGPSGTWVSSDDHKAQYSRWINNNIPNWIHCHKACGFGIHTQCRKFLADIRCEDDPESTSSRFKCNDVFVQLERKEIQEIYNRITSNNNKIQLEKARVAFQSRKTRLSRDRMRYKNDMSTCRFCKNLYDLHVKDHMMRECPVVGDLPTARQHRTRERVSKKGKWVDHPDDDIVFDRLEFFTTYHPP